MRVWPHKKIKDTKNPPIIIIISTFGQKKPKQKQNTSLKKQTLEHQVWPPNQTQTRTTEQPAPKLCEGAQT